MIERGYRKMQVLTAVINNLSQGKYKEYIKWSRPQPILGIDDEVLLLENIGWGDFLYLYHKEKGIFDPDYLAGTTTAICVKMQEMVTDVEDDRCHLNFNRQSESDRNNKDETDPRQIYRKYTESIRAKITRLWEGDNRYKELYTILNILPKFSDGVFSDYVFFAILKPLNMLVDLLQEGNDDCYYEFVKMVSVYAQNSTKSDRHSMQAMDFNAKFYNIPEKLNAFYTTLIYCASEVLNVIADKAVRVKDFPLETERADVMIKNLANVDGAILLDHTGCCKAFGVILDGKANVWGVEERGAGVNLEDSPYTNYPAETDMTRFLFIGRVMREKEIDELLSTMEQLYLQYPNIMLDIVGWCEKDYEVRMEQLQKLGFVKFHGF